MLMAFIASVYRGRRGRAWRLPTSGLLAALPPAMSMVSHFSTPAHATDAESDFERFIQQHECEVFGYLWRMTGDEQAAYDLSQEAFLRAWRHFASVAAYEQPRAWLFRVATRLALNYRRDRRPDTYALEPGEIDARPMAAPDPAERAAERDAIEAALLALPKRQRAALVLRDVYGYHAEEIATMLQVSRAAAKMTVSRAREQFRTAYLGEEAER